MALAPGTRLGAYEILSLLGKGGMGEVYKATDARLDRTVAIKIVPSADPELKARFERDGFITVPNLLSLEQLAALQARADEALSGVGPQFGDFDIQWEAGGGHC